MEASTCSLALMLVHAVHVESGVSGASGVLVLGCARWMRRGMASAAADVTLSTSRAGWWAA